MKAEEIIKALRCVSTAGREDDCARCPYWREENVPEELRPVYGADTMHSCDIDRVGLDGADEIEKLTDRCARYAEEIAALQERLKEYEDTGLAPEQASTAKALIDAISAKDTSKIERIRELMKADKDGRVVVLPAKTVYELTWDAGPDCDLDCPVSIDGHGCCDFCDKSKLFAYERTCQQEHIEWLGKLVFLTREEAKKALEARKDG